MATLQSALHIAQSYPVFPCGSDKKPRLKDWPNVATQDPKQIEHWWRLWPNALIGLPTGAKSGLLVLDVDWKNGHDGFKTLQERGWQFPLTRVIATRNDGQHIQFTHPEFAIIRNSASRLGDGLDIRGDGGYVICWEAEGCAVLVDEPPAPAPAWLLRTLTEPPAGNDCTATEGAAVLGAISPGQRNATLASLAGTMRRKGMSESAIGAALLVVNAERCKPPLPDAEIHQIARSVSRYTPQDTEPLDPAPAAPHHWPRLEPDDKPPHLCTDQANGYRIARHVGRDLLYVVRIGWHVWRETHWHLGEEFAYRKAHKLSRLILAESAAAAQKAADTEDSGKRKELMEMSEALTGWAAKSESRDRVYASMALAKPMLAIEHHELDRDHWLLNCVNGTLDLRTGVLRPHRRNDFITRCIPTAYDQQATCTRWLAFLDRIFASAADVIHFVQKAIGYTLTGDTSEQCVFFLWGGGQNGKSTLLVTVQALMGAYAQQAAPDLLIVSKHERHTTEIAELRGARLVASIETGDGRRLNEPLVKQMSGGDRMRGRFMRQDNIEFDPTHKVFLATNHKPVIRGTDHAIWRRIRLIPFTVTIPPEERDPKFPEKLKAELPGILVWAVQGCLAWQREGLEPPKEVTEATNQYRLDSDVLKAFFEDYCVIDRNAKVPKSKLYEAYREWCDRSGEYAETQRKFSDRMQERGFREYKTTGGLRTWQGIGVTECSGASGASGAKVRMNSACDFSLYSDRENNATNATCATNTPPAADDFEVL